MSLQKYRRKRSFQETPEPKGKESVRPKANRHIFVVQKHEASRLHYDFRLEVEGVLASWAVPKGPSLNPRDRRLAMQVEDHPLEYADFEGTIPEDHYGAGTVMVWDTGSYASSGSPADQLKRGEIKFELEGKKLRGSFVLVRLDSNRQGSKSSQPWLLIKDRDKFATAIWDINQFPLSATTGRDMDEITRGVKRRAKAV